MGQRWKGKGSEAKALADPMSKIVSQLKSTLIQSDSHGLLSGCSILLEVETEEQTELLNRACFGGPIVTAQKDKQWFQLGMEEAFYLYYDLKCLKIVGESKCTKNEDELWNYMKSKRETFPDFLKAYTHLRTRNWVVRSGSQYGVDFIAYRHHPALVHSEYAVLVLSEGQARPLSSQTQHLNVFPTVTMPMKTRLVGATRGQALLKKKSDALLVQFRPILKKIISAKELMGKIVKTSSFVLTEAMYVTSENIRTSSLKVSRMHRIKVRSRQENVAAMKLPKFEYFTEGDIKNDLTGLARGCQQVQACRAVAAASVKSIEVVVELASLQTSFLTVDEAIKTTNRKVHALANTVKPGRMW